MSGIIGFVLTRTGAVLEEIGAGLEEFAFADNLEKFGAAIKNKADSAYKELFDLNSEAEGADPPYAID